MVELTDGNIPDFMRKLKPVFMTYRGKRRRPVSATIWVTAIYRESAVRLKPQPMRPCPEMCSTLYFWNHTRMIESQRGGQPTGELVSGHKKDFVLTNRLRRKPGRVAIYGWHRRNRRPIQGLSTVHSARYADYSHGVRLVSTTVLVDGVPMSLFDVLEDPKLSGFLSDEGVIRARDLMSLQTDAAPPPTRPLSAIAPQAK